MPNSRRRMFHTCTGMLLFTVCNTLRGIGSPTVQERLRRPHNNIRPHFSSPSPSALSSFCQMSLLYQKPPFARCLETTRTCALRVIRPTQKTPPTKRLSPEAAHSAAGPNRTCQVCKQETATCNSFTFFFKMMSSLKQGAK